MKIEDIRIGMWVQELMPIPKRYTPPMMVTGIFKGSTPDNDCVYLELEEQDGDPFEAHPKDLIEYKADEEG